MSGRPSRHNVLCAQMPMHQPVRWKDDNILVPKHAGDPQVSILFYEVLPRSLELQERLKDVQVGPSGPLSEKYWWSADMSTLYLSLSTCLCVLLHNTRSAARDV